MTTAQLLEASWTVVQLRHSLPASAVFYSALSSLVLRASAGMQPVRGLVAVWLSTNLKSDERMTRNDHTTSTMSELCVT